MDIGPNIFSLHVILLFHISLEDCYINHRTEVRLVIYEPCHVKTCFSICENKCADQLHGDWAADQHLYFCYMDRTIPVLP